MFKNTFQSGFLSILYSIGYVFCALQYWIVLNLPASTWLFSRLYCMSCTALAEPVVSFFQEQTVTNLGEEK